MRTVRDPAGRDWQVEQIGAASNPVNVPPGREPPEPTLATLRVSSGDERFVVSIGLGWRELSNDELWAHLARARERKEQRRR